VTVRLTVEGAARGRLPRPDVLRRARAMMGALGLESRELSIVLTGDEQIRELNRVYRHKDKPTDVLSFSQLEGELADGADSLLGDVIVSIPTAERQARSRKTDLTSEVTMLLAHGLLHLVGWDHDTPAKDRKMKHETARLCAAATRLSTRAGRPVRRKEITK
jgi:probable rRNA maturation factor